MLYLTHSSFGYSSANVMSRQHHPHTRWSRFCGSSTAANGCAAKGSGAIPIVPKLNESSMMAGRCLLRESNMFAAYTIR